MYNVTLLPGDGVGPELTSIVLEVLEAVGVPIRWEVKEAGMKSYEQVGEVLPQEVIDSIRKNKVALKGPLTTPVGTGFRSVNVALRKELDLYANVRPAKSLSDQGKYKNIDLIVVRENTEDLYAGIEHMVGDDAAESIKIITRRGSERIMRFAFQHAVEMGRNKVTAVHKANIMKCTDGLFLTVARDVAKEFPQVEFEDRIVDNMCMQLVMKPQDYDVLVMPNLYGDIVSDLCAGLIGGLGLAPGANIGQEAAIFEPVHGSAPKYAGKNKVNPVAMLLSGVLMLRHLGEQEKADKIEGALKRVFTRGESLTYDLGGQATTTEMGRAVIEQLNYE